jgi:RNA polymerase sigma-70 factor (ECF subfamily)
LYIVRLDKVDWSMTQNSTQQDEHELVRRAAGGDADAFGDLYMRYLDDIYRYVFYKVGNEERAEDLTEHVFLKAWEAVEDYEQGEYPFSSWLYRIAHNAVVDHYRGQKDQEPLESVSFRLADDALGPEERLINEAEVTSLCEALRQLSEEKQQLIILRFVQGLPHAEVAEILGKSEGACRVMQHRALQTLNEIMTKS